MGVPKASEEWLWMRCFKTKKPEPARAPEKEFISKRKADSSCGHGIHAKAVAGCSTVRRLALKGCAKRIVASELASENDLKRAAVEGELEVSVRFHPKGVAGGAHPEAVVFRCAALRLGILTESGFGAELDGQDRIAPPREEAVATLAVECVGGTLIRSEDLIRSNTPNGAAASRTSVEVKQLGSGDPTLVAEEGVTGVYPALPAIISGDTSLLEDIESQGETGAKAVRVPCGGQSLPTLRYRDGTLLRVVKGMQIPAID